MFYLFIHQKQNFDEINNFILFYKNKHLFYYAKLATGSMKFEIKFTIFVICDRLKRL